MKYLFVIIALIIGLSMRQHHNQEQQCSVANQMTAEGWVRN